MIFAPNACFLAHGLCFKLHTYNTSDKTAIANSGEITEAPPRRDFLSSLCNRLFFVFLLLLEYQNKIPCECGVEVF